MEEGEGVEEDDWGYVRLQTVKGCHGEPISQTLLIIIRRKKAYNQIKEAKDIDIFFDTVWKNTHRAKQMVKKESRTKTQSSYSETKAEDPNSG